MDELHNSQPTQSIGLTHKEKIWLKKHQPIRIAFENSFSPYSFIDKSNHIAGFSYDTIKLISQKLDFQIKIDPRVNRKEISQAILNKEIHAIANISNNKAQEQPLTFTSPYIFESLVIIGRKENKQIKKPTDLSEKKVALVKKHTYYQRIIKEVPHVIPVDVKDNHAALMAIESQKADATITLFTANYYALNKKYPPNVAPIIFYDHGNTDKRIAVHNDWLILAKIFQKGLNTITLTEKRAMSQKWFPSSKQLATYKLVKRIFNYFLLTLFALLLWVLLIRAQSRSITIINNDTRNKNERESDLKENHKNQFALHSEQKYRSLVENLQDKYFFYQHDVDGIYTYVSPSITSILGYKVEEFLKHYSTFQTTHPDNANIDGYTARGLSGEKVPSYEVELYDNEGHKRCLEILESPIYNEKRQCIGLEGIAHDITLLNQTRQKLNWLSYYDDLTGLANRRLFKDRVEQSIAVAHKNNESMAILFMDLDRFKIVNDSLGHAAGDEVLKETALRLNSQLRDSDFAARMGGDEFTVILPNCHIEAAKIVAIKILHSLIEPYMLKDRQFNLGASIGIALYPQDGMESKILLQQADSAMFYAKKEKLGYAFCSSDLHKINNYRLVLEQDLRKALEQNRYDDNFELKVFFQNKHSVHDSRILGYEALIRWNHPQMGYISPEDFIPIAEETGLIVDLSRWVITRVCMHTTRWVQQGFSFGKIAINISAVELINFDLAKNIIAQIDATGAQRNWFEIEITETALMKMPDVAIEVIQQLVDAGLLIAIDDFGTGYSSLSYLKNIPASYIKIDQSFIRNVITSQEDQAVVHAIIAMSHALGKKVIAEGVETEDQLDFLTKSGCDIAQGFLFSKPVSAQEITLRSERKNNLLKKRLDVPIPSPRRPYHLPTPK